jgi:hypothetical protein
MRSFSWRATLRTCGALSLILATPAVAGITDPNLPSLPETLARPKVVYSVIGVVNGAVLATVFRCTNIDEDYVEIGVELFDSDGSRINSVSIGNGSLFTLPGQTGTFSTGAVSAFGADEVILLQNILHSGSARIVASSRKILCDALIVDRTTNAPASMVTLPVFSRLKQKGD